MKIRCEFMGARPLKDGSRTGMVTFVTGIDKHALIDLEGEAWLTNESEETGHEALTPLGEYYFNLASQITRDLAERLRQEREIGMIEGLKAAAQVKELDGHIIISSNATDLMAGPVEGIVARMEEKEGMCQFPDMNRDGLD